MATLKYNAGKKIQIELEGEFLELFSQLSSVEDMFADQKCGVCGSEQTRFTVREVEGTKKQKYTYYERVCSQNSCRAKLAYGVHQNGKTLFPKRKNEDGTFDNKSFGWSKYRKDDVPSDD